MSYRTIVTHPLQAVLKGLYRAAASRPVAQAAAGLGAFATPFLALANPTGGQVVAGSANITTPSANGMVIDQGSQNAIINWNSFSIDGNQYVQFQQPNSSSVVLNRVTGANPSSIFGSLTANGHVFLVNPNGVFFAPGASVDVQGLVASTLDIQNSDFMAGHYVFSKPSGSTGTVVNQGTITAADGGFVVLAGKYVENDGVIQARMGHVVMAAGNQVTLTLGDNDAIGFQVDAKSLAQAAGVDNAGSIFADGGAVLMTADVANALTATAVNNSGFIRAQSIQNHDGVIILAANGGNIENSGTLDARGGATGVQGGTIIVHGNGRTELTSTSKVMANGDQATGGFIELSGHDLAMHGLVKAGHGGSVLIDPAKIVINSGNTLSQVSMGTGTIGVGFIKNKLNFGSNVTIVASNSVASTGSLNLTGVTGAGQLTIAVGTVTGTQCGIGGICVSNATLPTVTVTPGTGIISLSGLTVSIGGKFVASAGQTVTLGNITAKTVKVTGRYINVGNVTTSGAGGIGIVASSAGTNVQIQTKSLTANGTGKIQLTTRGNNGGNISVSGAVNAGGSFTANASASAGGGGDVYITGGNVTAKSIQITAHGQSGGGNIKVNGLHATGPATNGGIQISASEPVTAFGSGYLSASGNLVADNGSISIQTSGGGDSSGGHVYVTGNLTAGLGVAIGAHYIGTCSCGGPQVQTGNITGDYVHINTFGPIASIQVGALTAKGTAGSNDVAVIMHSAGGGTPGSGNMHIGGAVKSSFGNVTLNAAGYHGSLTMSGASAAAMKITAGGAVNVYGRHISLGGVSAAGNVSIAANPFNGTADIVAGAIKGNSVHLSMEAAYGGAVSVGNVTATGANGGLSIYTYAFSTGNVVDIKAGNLAAGKGGVRINQYNYGGTGSLTVGNITSPYISIAAQGNQNDITTGALTATSANGPAWIQVYAYDYSGSNAITVNGNITASGKAPAHPSQQYITPYGMPLAAHVGIQASGGSYGGHDVKVAGAINVTATAGNFSYNGRMSGEAGPNLKATGKGGVADVYIVGDGQSASAIVTGNINVKGPDAHVVMHGNVVKAGNITVTGSGHTVTRKITGSSATYTSNNSAGQATVELGRIVSSYSGSSNAANVTAGTITVSGKGVAEVGLFASSVAAGNVTATATAASGTRKHSSNFSLSCFSSNCAMATSGMFYLGIGEVTLGSGSLTAGRAEINVGLVPGNVTSSSGMPLVADVIKAGNLSATGVGRAEIGLKGSAVQVGAVSAIATKGTEKGKGSSFSGSGSHLNKYKHTFTINGGTAGVDIETDGGTVKVGGNLSVQGPAAGVFIKSKDIKVAGTLAAIGSGGSMVSDTKATLNGGASTFHTHYTGPNPEQGLQLMGSSGSVNVTGKVTVKGQGLVPVIAVGNSLTLGGLSASVTAAASYSILDTRVSATADSFTAGSLVAFVTAVGTSSFAPATINGNLTLSAKQNVYLELNDTVTGKIAVTAGGDIGTDASSAFTRFNAIQSAMPRLHSGSSSSGGPSATPALNLTGASLAMTAGGNIGLSGASLTVGSGAQTFSAGGSLDVVGANLQAATGVSLKAGTTLLFCQANITAGSAFIASGQTGLSGSSANVQATSATIKSTGGNVDLTATGLNVSGGNATVSAGGNLSLSGITLNAGAGSVSLDAGGSIDLTSASLKASQGILLAAGKHILLGQTAVNAGGAFSASAHGSISNGGSAGSIQASSVKMNAATGNLVLSGTPINVGSGAAVFSAAGNILMTGATLNAGQLTETAGGNIDLSGATLTVSGEADLAASGNIVLSGVDIHAGVFTAVAGGSIHNGGTTGSISAGALLVAAVGDVTLGSTAITVGSGTVPGVLGDSQAILALGLSSIEPASVNPNATFISGGTLTLGKLTFKGSYLYLQADNLNLLGTVSVPGSILVQITPYSTTQTLGIESGSGGSGQINYSYDGLLSLFNGDTILVGNVDQTGSMTVGASGVFTIPDGTNLIIDTTGAVTGLENVTGTGLITTVQAILAGGTVIEPPTSGEIDPNSAGTTGENNNSTEDDNKKKSTTGGGEVEGTETQGGTVSQDTGSASVCH